MDWMVLLTLLGVAVVAVLCVLIWRSVSRPADSDMAPMLAALRDELARGNERIERELRGAIGETARIGRSDVSQQLGQFQQVLATQLTSVATVQNNQIDTFAQQLTKLTESNTQQLEAVRQNLQQQACRPAKNRPARCAVSARPCSSNWRSWPTATSGGWPKCAPRWSRSSRTSRPTTRPSSTRCGAPSTRSCMPRWSSAWASRSSWCPTGWSRCIAAWAKCRRWRRASAT